MLEDSDNVKYFRIYRYFGVQFINSILKIFGYLEAKYY